MRNYALILGITLLSFSAQAQTAQGGGPTVLNALVPQYCQGIQPTNNNRVPCWFWATLSGLTPNATYRYYTTMDTLNASPTSNGAGVPLLVNANSGTIRRTTNPSLSNNANHDSLTADSNGVYSGWFGVDASGNGRYTPGNTLYPKFIMNNGAGGTSVAYRLVASNYPVSVINFGTTNSSTEGTALYDSLGATAKNFICVYDSVNMNGRPISIAIVENDGLNLFAITSTAAFYRNNVDTLDMHWGTIIPNMLANGIRGIEERSFSTGGAVNMWSDADGYWCSGVNTANMTGGNAGIYLNSTFSLTSSANIPDTVWTGLPAYMDVTTNDPNANITWDFGDSSSDTLAMTSHTYNTPGVVQVVVVISNGGCSDTIVQNVMVMLATSTPRIVSLGFDVFPNPSTGLFNVKSPSAIEKEIEVYNVLGETVFTYTYTGNTTTIDLSNLDKGVYFIRIKENVSGGKNGTKRIIIE
jgi:hypothetical protein